MGSEERCSICNGKPLDTQVVSALTLTSVRWIYNAFHSPWHSYLPLRHPGSLGSLEDEFYLRALDSGSGRVDLGSWKEHTLQGIAELAKPDSSSTSCVKLFTLQPYAGAEDTQWPQTVHPSESICCWPTLGRVAYSLRRVLTTDTCWEFKFPKHALPQISCTSKITMIARLAFADQKIES